MDTTLFLDLKADNAPLYSYYLYNDPYFDNTTGENFYLCIITKWTDKSAAARECGHKSFYFNGKFADIRGFMEKIKDSDADLKRIYSAPENSRFYISHCENYKIYKF